MKKKRFFVNKQHLKLLRNANITWCDAGFGAPGMDSKKPYGNSTALHDIAEILGLEFIIDEGEEKRLTNEQAQLCKKFHCELEVALQILTSNLSIEVGEYECEPYGNKWKRVI